MRKPRREPSLRSDVGDGGRISAGGDAGVGVKGRGLVYNEGGEDRLRGGFGIGASVGMGVGEDGAWRAVGIAWGGDGDASGVNRPLYTFSRPPFVALLPSKQESRNRTMGPAYAAPNDLKRYPPDTTSMRTARE
jgi:hypothetical protein